QHIDIGQSLEAMATAHDLAPIDCFVYTSALPPDHHELAFCREQGIKLSKRDELLNQILREKNLKLIAIAGTHGKTTTTAMVVWLFKELGLSVSYSVGAKISFGEMGQYEPDSNYFVYECDEFDRNFLAFEPYISLISGVSWDHHEIFPTREDYQAAFQEFISQTKWTLIWQDDFDYLNLQANDHYSVEDPSNPKINDIHLAGRYN